MYRSFTQCIRFIPVMLWLMIRNTYEICLEGIQPCTMKNRDIYGRRYKIQETLYIGQWHLSLLQSRHLGTSHSSPNRHQLPRRTFLNLTDGLKSLSFQRWFWFWEKPAVTGHLIWAVEGLNHLDDLMFHQKTLRRDAWAGTLLWQSCHHQLPIAAAFWVIQIVAIEECFSLTQDLMQIYCSVHSVILNVRATQYTRSLNGVYRPTD